MSTAPGHWRQRRNTTWWWFLFWAFVCQLPLELHVWVSITKYPSRQLFSRLHMLRSRFCWIRIRKSFILYRLTYILSFTKAEREREREKRQYSKPGPTLRQFYVVIELASIHIFFSENYVKWILTEIHFCGFVFCFFFL